MTSTIAEWLEDCEVESYRDRRRGELTWRWLCGLTEVEEPLPPVRMFNSGVPLSEIRLQ